MPLICPTCQLFFRSIHAPAGCLLLRMGLFSIFSGALMSTVPLPWLRDRAPPGGAVCRKARAPTPGPVAFIMKFYRCRFPMSSLQKDQTLALTA